MSEDEMITDWDLRNQIAVGADWEFDFFVHREADETLDHLWSVYDRKGFFVCTCESKDNAQTVAGALNAAFMKAEQS